jgi:hypothetical protein
MRVLFVPLLAAGVFATGSASAQPEVAPRPRVAELFPTRPDGDAGAKLPPPKEPRLPEWAKVLAGPLPKTAAKMLELDYLQREQNPLGRELSAWIRMDVAAALDCQYGIAIAKSDLLRLPFMSKNFTPAEEVARRFAKKLTLEGHAITDKEFAEVLEHFGPAKTTAIVHTVAYANFFNRIVLGFGIKGESPPLPPVAVKFDLDAAKVSAPPRPPWDDLKEVKAGGLSVRVDWSEGDATQLNRKLESQKERSLRIRLPDKKVYEKLTEKEQDSSRRIMWNTVSMGYQPEMTRAWFACLYTYYTESSTDRVFANATFWVVTRTNDCFY